MNCHIAQFTFGTIRDQHHRYVTLGQRGALAQRLGERFLDLFQQRRVVTKRHLEEGRRKLLSGRRLHDHFLTFDGFLNDVADLVGFLDDAAEALRHINRENAGSQYENDQQRPNERVGLRSRAFCGLAVPVCCTHATTYCV